MSEYGIQTGLFSQLENYCTVQAGKIPFQASVGKAHVLIAVIVSCLKEVDCCTMRLKDHGQKMPNGGYVI